MSAEQLNEMLKNYSSTKARCAYLRSQVEMLERFLKQCEGSMINDQVSMSQAITGMPHGSNPGDPVGRLAIDIASGKVSVFVKQIREEIEQVREELRITEQRLRTIEIVLSAMTERERQVVELKIIDGLSWIETLDKMNHAHGNSYSKRTLQRMMSDAIMKALAVVR